MKNNKWPIAKITFIALLCLQIVTVGLMILISQWWGEEAYLKHVRRLTQSLATQSVQSVEALLQPAEQLIRSGQGILESEVVSVEPTETLERYFFEQLKANANFTNIYFGWLNGDFLFIKQGNPDSKGFFESRYVVTKNGVRRAQNIYRSAIFSEIKREPGDAQFDPRTRPWFKVVGGTDLKWTAPYLYYTSRKLGVTVSIPVLDKNKEPIGVLGLDIEVNNLSYFLSKNELSPNSSALIATPDRRVVAHTDSDAIMKVDPNDPKSKQLVKIIDMDDPVASKALEALDDSGQPFVSNEVRPVAFKHNDEPYHAVFHSYNKRGVSWTVLVVAPESDFLEPIRNAQRWQIFAAVLCSLVITLIAFLVALRFLKPVNDLQESVLRNSLTGLYNRRAFDSFSDSIVKEIHAEKQPVSIAMIDIDHFKAINDSYGHATGDEVLVAVSLRMLNTIKKTDVLARYGGEEFVLLMVGADVAAAQKVCERIRQVVKQSILTKAGDIPVSVSIGVQEIAMSDDYFQDALIEADQALYSAKRNGRDQVCVAAGMRDE